MKKHLFLYILIAIFIFPCSSFAATLKVSLLMNGDIVTDSFNKSCVSGLKGAKTHFPKKIETAFYTSKPTATDDELYTLMDSVAQKSDVLIITGYSYTKNLDKISEKYPKLSIYSFDPKVKPPVKKILFKEDEGAFLAGVLAARLTTMDNIERVDPNTNKIAIILGKKIEATSSFERGYKAGAWYADKKTEVLSEYIDSFADKEKMRECALKMKSKGADIIFCVAGIAGNGAIEIAKASNFWIIGVDTEQEKKYPDAVLTSVVKRADYIIYKVIVAALFKGKEDTFSPLGLKDGCVDISLWTRESLRVIPLKIRDEIDGISDKIEQGLIIIK
ncbi:MAG: BMP family ABC transporter substrate-binding protein [Synergistaceae bacterium]